MTSILNPDLYWPSYAIGVGFILAFVAGYLIGSWRMKELHREIDYQVTRSEALSAKLADYLHPPRGPNGRFISRERL
jgi:hypothetical protein